MNEGKRSNRQDEKRESGMPGGGAGRRDEVKGSPIYPGSGPFPPGESTTMTPGQFGGGAYEESGESEIFDPMRHDEPVKKND